MKKQYRNNRAKERIELAMFDSMKKMAAQTPIPLALLKEANDRGCGFASHHGRCDLMEFLEWLITVKMPELSKQEEGSAPGVDWAGKDKEESARTRKVKRLALESKLIDFEGSRQFIIKLMTGTVFAELDRMAFEFPSALKGKNEVMIHQEVNKQIDMLRSAVLKLVENWEASKGKKTK